MAISGLTPLASVQDTLGWHFQVDATDETSSYFLTVAFVGEQSGLSFLPINKQGDLQLGLPIGKKWSWVQQLDGKAEAGVLVFMVQHEQLNEQFANSPYNVNLAQDFLKQQSEASQVYFFETTQQTSVCKTTHD